MRLAQRPPVSGGRCRFVGASATVGFTVLGRQAASLLVDEYGLLELTQRKVSGVALLFGGVLALRLI